LISAEVRRQWKPLVLKHAPLRNGSEVAWALWAAITFEINLASASAQAVSLMEDDFALPLACDQWVWLRALECYGE
jgi:hypothetical protein